jgi:hypothetical protein
VVQDALTRHPELLRELRRGLRPPEQVEEPQSNRLESRPRATGVVDDVDWLSLGDHRVG